VNILITPVRCRGPEAAAEIIRAIRDLQLYPGIDVIILARGGGSWKISAPFNDEGVARQSPVRESPIISAVGQ